MSTDQIDNHETHVFTCPVCKGHALNKGIIKQGDDQFRQVFCIKDGSQLVPLKENLTAVSKLDHEFDHYRNTHLERTYIETFPERHNEYLNKKQDQK